MIFADRAVVFDHREGMTYLLALADEGTGLAGQEVAVEDTARSWLTRTASRLDALAGLVPNPDPAPPAVGTRVELRHDRQAYLNLIDSCGLSDAEAEFEETAVKAEPLLALTGGAFPGRKPATAVSRSTPGR